MGSAPKPPEAPPTPEPATPVDVQAQGNVRQSLLKKRTGVKESWLTKGQLLNKGNQL